MIKLNTGFRVDLLMKKIDISKVFWTIWFNIVSLYVPLALHESVLALF